MGRAISPPARPRGGRPLAAHECLPSYGIGLPRDIVRDDRIPSREAGIEVPRTDRDRAVPMVAVVAFWTLPVLFSAAQHMLFSPPHAAGAGLLELILRPAPGWYLWAAYTVLIFHLVRAVPLSRDRWRRSLGVHGPTALILALLHVAVLVAANRIGADVATSWGEHYRAVVSQFLHVDLLLYAGVLSLAHVVHVFQDASGRPEPPPPDRSDPSDPAEEADRRFLIRHGDRVIPVPHHAVAWIEAVDYYARLHTADAAYLVRESLASLERRLDRGRFFRVHRSAIVNLSAVNEIRSGERRQEVVLEDGTEVPLARRRRAAFEDWLRTGA